MALAAKPAVSEDFVADVKTFVKDVSIDLAAATVAGAAVAPFVVAVDKAIAENASGKQPLWNSFFGSCRQMVTNPVAYLRQPAYRYLVALFAGTYTAANLFTTFEDRRQTTYALGKSATVFAANSSLSLWKDSAFARIFGTKPPANIPATSLVSWWSRDFMGMAVIFVGPPVLAKHLHETMGVNERKAEFAAQIGLPLMVQPFVAPFHLLGYVVYNDPSSSWAARMGILRSEYWGTLCMRWTRVFPPFCIGTNVNKSLRRTFKGIE